MKAHLAFNEDATGTKPTVRVSLRLETQPWTLILPVEAAEALAKELWDACEAARQSK